MKQDIIVFGIDELSQKGGTGMDKLEDFSWTKTGI